MNDTEASVIATVWVHEPDAARAAREGTHFGLPLEAHLRLPTHAGLDPVQVSHAACHPDWRSKGVSRMLWDRCLATTAGRDLFIAAATGLREAPDAAGLFQQLRDTAQGWQATLRVPSRGAACVTPREGAVPWLIGSYGRIGFRPAGEPIYFPQFGMFDLPMWLPWGARARRAA